MKVHNKGVLRGAPSGIMECGQRQDEGAMLRESSPQSSVMGSQVCPTSLAGGERAECGQVSEWEEVEV